MTDFEKFAELVNQRIKQETEGILETLAESNSKIEENVKANEELKESMYAALELADKKFRIVGRLIKSVMDAVEKLHPDAKKCEDDTKGLEALMGTQKEKAEGQKEEE